MAESNAKNLERSAHTIRRIFSAGLYRLMAAFASIIDGCRLDADYFELCRSRNLNTPGKVEATGGRAHNLDGVSEPYNGGTRHARCDAVELPSYTNRIKIIL